MRLCPLRFSQFLILHVAANTIGDSSENWLSQVVLYKFNVDAWPPSTPRLTPFTLEAPKPTQNKHCVYTSFFEKIARTFSCFLVTRIRNPREIPLKNSFR